MNTEWHAKHVLPKRATVEERIAWHTEHQKFCACRPIPAKLKLEMLRRAAPPTAAASFDQIRTLLAGGDRRSIADSARVRAMVEGDPSLVPSLAALTGDADPLVVQRALDLLEKLAHEHADWIEPHKRIFIGPLAQNDRWEIRLQIVRALPLFRWTSAQRKRAEVILIDGVAFEQTFVRAWALDSLAQFADTNAALRPIVLRRLREFERSSSKALGARARQIRARMARVGLRKST